MSRIKALPYDWPLVEAMTRDDTALVVIDMQRDFCEEGGYLALQGYDISTTRAIIPSIQALLSEFRRLKMAVFHTREGHRADLSDLPERERLRSISRTTGVGIGMPGPMGRLLVRGEPGHDIVPELYPRTGEPIIDKPGKGAFTNTDFDLLLRVKSIKNLIFCGVTTDVCVHSTMREANDRGFDCLLIEDCCAASEESLHLATIASTRAEGGVFGATAPLQAVLEALHH